ncbi:MAG: hypothetical protein AB7N76_13695 [Planctomycetota bacterium]
MGRDDKQGSTVGGVARAAMAPVGLLSRLGDFADWLLPPLAMLVGILGCAALVGCGVLYLTPSEAWPMQLNQAQLPVYATFSLVAGSLLGWGCMQKGMIRMREVIGWTVGGWLVVLLPLACAGAVFLDAHGYLTLASAPGAPWTARFARWYPSALIVLSLLVHLAGQWRKTEGEDRALRRSLAVALMLPYCVMLGVFEFGLESPLLSDQLRRAVASLGSGAIVLQLALLYFLSAPAR